MIPFCLSTSSPGVVDLDGGSPLAASVFGLVSTLSHPLSFFTASLSPRNSYFSSLHLVGRAYWPNSGFGLGTRPNTLKSTALRTSNGRSRRLLTSSSASATGTGAAPARSVSLCRGRGTVGTSGLNAVSSRCLGARRAPLLDSRPPSLSPRLGVSLRYLGPTSGGHRKGGHDRGWCRPRRHFPPWGPWRTGSLGGPLGSCLRRSRSRSEVLAGVSV